MVGTAEPCQKGGRCLKITVNGIKESWVTNINMIKILDAIMSIITMLITTTAIITIIIIIIVIIITTAIIITISSSIIITIIMHSLVPTTVAVNASSATLTFRTPITTAFIPITMTITITA